MVFTGNIWSKTSLLISMDSTVTMIVMSWPRVPDLCHCQALP